MKLLRLKITNPEGFRGLQAGFEYYFRTEWEVQSELGAVQGFSPFVCAGRNGSGKSNLLEVLAEIFFQLEVQRARRSFLPAPLLNDEIDSAPPVAYELEYLIKLPLNALPESDRYAHVRVIKTPQSSPQMYWLNPNDFGSLSDDLAADGLCGEREREFLLPEYVVGYSSGENEILSLPFFKMRFVQFDEYWNALTNQLPYPGRPETRLAYLDSSFSQAILLCNLLFQDMDTLKPFREDVGVDELKEFRIIIKRSIQVSAKVAQEFINDSSGFRGFYGDGRGVFNDGDGFYDDNPAFIRESGSGQFTVNLMQLLESGVNSADNYDPIVTRLKRCATCYFVDEATDTLYLDYYVNDDTKKAFRENFDFEVNKTPIALFQAFQVLLALNLYSVSNQLKADLYLSDSHYVSETVPTLASNERIMRFELVKFSKVGNERPVMLKSLSDGEHQMLHTLGLCLLFQNTNTLFLLDEPETHFNPDWRANFITRLRQCLPDKANDNVGQEMLITTHTPFLISDSKPDKVLVFSKDKTNGVVSISHPDYNTLGASINKITMNTFGKRETIGGHAQEILDGLRARFEQGAEDKEVLMAEIHQQLGDSVEKLLLIKAILDSEQQGDGATQG